MNDDDQDFHGLLDAPEAMTLIVCSLRRLTGAVADPYRGARSVADEFFPVVPGRNRAEARANAARMRRA